MLENDHGEEVGHRRGGGDAMSRRRLEEFSRDMGREEGRAQEPRGYFRVDFL